MKTRSLALAMAVLGAMWAPTARADQALATALEKVSKDQIAAINREDAPATMAYSHTKSPSYEEARKELSSLFGETDAKAEQISFQYIGHDDEFALARVKVKVTAAGEEGFYDNVVDTITIFHQEDGKWKVWDAYLVGGVLVE
jgi:hypothetical protein